MLNSVTQATHLAQEYKIPVLDVILIALNILGVRFPGHESRLRFHLTPKGESRQFLVAVSRNEDAPFTLAEDVLLLGSEAIGNISSKDNDTCTVSYFRRNGTALTLNSNSRSRCFGCTFCGTHSLESNEEPLLEREALTDHLKFLASSVRENDFRFLKDVCVCTGCFPSSDDLINHLELLSSILRDKFHFQGSITYLGSQIGTQESLLSIQKVINDFRLYYSVDIFFDRSKHLHPVKNHYSLQDIQKTLLMAKGMGIRAGYSYVLGLEDATEILNGASFLLNATNTFPLINIFQPYTDAHIELRHPRANQLDYYLQIRKSLEHLYHNCHYRPLLWQNYRSLWYSMFGHEEKNEIPI